MLTFLANSTTASCIPRQMPKYGIPFVRAYVADKIFPWTPLSPNPPGTSTPCEFCAKQKPKSAHVSRNTTQMEKERHNRRSHDTFSVFQAASYASGVCTETKNKFSVQTIMVNGCRLSRWYLTLQLYYDHIRLLFGLTDPLTAFMTLMCWKLQNSWIGLCWYQWEVLKVA